MWLGCQNPAQPGWEELPRQHIAQNPSFFALFFAQGEGNVWCSSMATPIPGTKTRPRAPKAAGAAGEGISWPCSEPECVFFKRLWKAVYSPCFAGRHSHIKGNFLFYFILNGGSTNLSLWGFVGSMWDFFFFFFWMFCARCSRCCSNSGFGAVHGQLTHFYIIFYYSWPHSLPRLWVCPDLPLPPSPF